MSDNETQLITQEMIEAGADRLFEAGEIYDYGHVAREVYLAMARLSCPLHVDDKRISDEWVAYLWSPRA